MEDKKCNKCAKTGLYALAWILYIIILVPAFLWSSQVLVPEGYIIPAELVHNNNDYFNNGDNIEKFSDINIMRHQEYHNDLDLSTKDWILNSNVCPLGKFVFYFVILMYLAYLITILFIPHENSKILSYVVLGITVLIYIGMLMSNLPFAIRSIPAFLAAGSIISIGLLAKPKD